MATTSLSLGPHWEDFIRSMTADGRYGSASEVVRDSLRLLEERELVLREIRDALEAGERSGDAGLLDMNAIKRKARDGVR